MGASIHSADSTKSKRWKKSRGKEPLSDKPLQIDGRDVRLICWLDWYDGPVSGLARWRGEVVWFAIDSDADAEPRQYRLYALDPQQIGEAKTWFEEKLDWFETRAPIIQQICAEMPDKADREKEIAARDLALRDWKGPQLSAPPVAYFDDGGVDRSWFDHAGWRLPDDFGLSDNAKENLK